jgi:hypothetical protein
VVELREEERPYRALVPLYDRLTRAAYEVMGVRWVRFREASDAFRAAAPGTPQFHELGERAYRLGLRSTRAYFLWTRGHTALVLARVDNERAAAA